MHHYSVHGDFDLQNYFSANVYFVQCLGMFGKLGVNLFVLISGYFLCTSKFNWKRLLRIELQVLFYSATIGILFFIFLPQKIGVKSLIKCFFPLLKSQYWFYTTYFVLVCLSPYINIFIKAAKKDDLQKLILCLSFLWVILPFVPKFDALEYSNLVWFIFLYIIASYIRLYGEQINIKNSIVGIFALISFLLVILSVLCFDLLGLWNKMFFEKYNYFKPQNSLLIFACSVFTFLFFSKLKMKQNKFINLISSATFGVYLIHDNNFVRPFLWVDLFKNATYLDTSSIYLHAIINIVLVYVVCTVIDLLRQLAIKCIKKIMHISKK